LSWLRVVWMESEIKRDAIRDCLASYSKALRDKKGAAVIINDTNIDFYGEVTTHFSGIPFDYVRTVFEDPYGLALGMLAARKELGMNFAVIIISQHHSVYHMTPFTLGDLFRAEGDVHILLFESHMAKRISDEGMPVVQDELIESVIPSSMKLDFDFMHSFFWISEKFESEYFAMASAAYGEDLKQKAFNAVSTCNNSIIVAHSPSVRESDNTDFLQKAVECGYVRLYESRCDGSFKINYVPSFIPVSEFLGSDPFFSGISEAQVQEIQKKVYSWWESKAPGRMPHPKFIEKEVGGVDFGVSQPQGHSADERLANMKNRLSDSAPASRIPGDKKAEPSKFGFSEIEDKDIDTLDSIPSSEVAKEREEAAKMKAQGEHASIFSPPKKEERPLEASKPAGIGAPSEIRLYTGMGQDEKESHYIEPMREEPARQQAKPAISIEAEKPAGGIESMIDSSGTEGEGAVEGIAGMLEPEESRKIVEQKLAQKEEKQKEKQAWPYYQGEEKPPSGLSGMIDSVEEQSGLGKIAKEEPRQAAKPPEKKKPHADSSALDGMLEDV